MPTQTFEKAMKQLEKIVDEMESGELPLEKSLKKFEEGIALSRFCSKLLEDSEDKITLLLKDEAGNIRESSIKKDSGQEAAK